MEGLQRNPPPPPANVLIASLSTFAYKPAASHMRTNWVGWFQIN